MLEEVSDRGCCCGGKGIQTDADAVPGSHEVGSEVVVVGVPSARAGGRPFEVMPGDHTGR